MHSSQSNNPFRPELRAIQRKLDRWELQHLREHATELAEQLERAEAELQMTRRDADHAYDVAEGWRHQALDLAQSLDDDSERCVGLTKDGAILIVPSAECYERNGKHGAGARSQLLDKVSKAPGASYA